jgi:hypothetical protein
MPLKEILDSWSIDTRKINGINDVRLRFVPSVEFVPISATLIEFISFNGNEKYRVKTHNLISKGSNGRIYEAYRTSNNGYSYTPLVVKKTKCCLNALRECVLQAMVHEDIPDNCPQIYNIFRTKTNFWIFMQDLRKPVKKVKCAKSLYYWLNAIGSFAGRKEASIKKILGLVFTLLLDLQQKNSFKHGDLHIQNIFIHSSDLDIKKVYLLDFGYSMVKDRDKYSVSPYWLEYKPGVDCAILLWSLWQNISFKNSVSPSMLLWISDKLVLADGFDLKSLLTPSDIYQKIDNLPLISLKQFHTEIVAREFLSV